jgi:hypothetical protein
MYQNGLGNGQGNNAEYFSVLRAGVTKLNLAIVSSRVSI